MKKTTLKFMISVIAFFTATATLFSQSPQQLNYQAVARDVSGNPITDTQIVVAFTIRQGSSDGPDIFTEEHTVTTNAYGLVNLSIGSIEDLSVVPWEDGPFFLKVDIEGAEVGISEIKSVPYSLMANENDPVFSGSAASGVTSVNLSNWNSAFAWGNHANAGYLSAESDPVFVLSPAYGITTPAIGQWNQAYSWGDHAGAGYLSAESDPVFISSPAYGISSPAISNWNSAFAWGNHAEAGYMTSSPWALSNNKLSYNSGYVGVGTSVPRSRLSVQGLSPEDTILFEVKNSLGQTVFAVYNQGVHITIDEDYSKGSRGGFSVGGFDRTKSVQEYLRITADSARIYINQNAKKGPRGGFSVGGFDRNAGKGATFNYVSLTPENSFLGPSAGSSISTGVNNFFAGYQAGMSNQTGNDNIFIGTAAGLNNNSNANIFIGVNAGAANTTAFGSVILGDNAGVLNNGSRNIIIGRRTAVSNTTGDNNVYIGNDAGYLIETARDNTFVGAEAGFHSTSGSYDVYLGHRAGYDNDGSYNVVIGELAGSNKNNYSNPNTTYDYSVFVGNMSGYSITTGDYNSFFGNGSGSNVTTGSRNTYIGSGAGSNANGNNNVLIGYGAGSSITGDNKLIIHNWNTGTPLVYGEFHSVPSAALFRINGAFEVTEMGVGTGTTVVIDANGRLLKTSSSERYKSDISSLDGITETFMNLRPVSFTWNDKSSTPGKGDFGLIAEEVAELMPELAITDGSGTPEGVSYHNVNIMAVKVIQQQQKEIDELKARLAETEKMLEMILQEMK